MNFWRLVKIVGCTTVAVIAAPVILPMLGAAGVLGAAGTGTAIVTLHGAALTSASIASVGGTAAIARAGAYVGSII
jgi:hypothetical protein